MVKSGEVVARWVKGKWGSVSYLEGLIDVRGKRYKIVIFPNMFNPDANFEIFLREWREDDTLPAI